MPWIDQDIQHESAQFCGCDMGCKPEPHICERHQAEKIALAKGLMERAVKAQWDQLYEILDKEIDHPQDATTVSATLGDTCPRCGTTLEHVDGLERDYPHCPRCRRSLA